MKLELGKSYLTRDNKKVKIIKEGLLWPYTYLGDNAQSYTENGRRWYGDDEVKCIEDLIILWEEEQVETSNDENCRLLGMSAERELALLAEIDRLKAKLAKTEWRPIESAPHGIWILIFAYENVCQACWDSNGYWSTFRENRIQPIAATHWMPLPEPPTTEETKCLK